MASAQYYGQDYKRVFSLKLLHLKVMALFVYLYSVTDTAILIMHVHNGKEVYMYILSLLHAVFARGLQHLSVLQETSIILQ